MNIIPIDLNRRLCLYFTAVILALLESSGDGNVHLNLLRRAHLAFLDLRLFFLLLVFSHNCYQRTGIWELGRLIWVYRASHVCSSFMVIVFYLSSLFFLLLDLLLAHRNLDMGFAIYFELHVSSRRCLGLKR
ncbi:hypothetical protein BJY00DRAFT_225368 [Aspergillus carlsbadensis]|nr:hypothetical protein BJY00DRAFT_225368 [Aspergillus carlsbadensis]